MQQATESVDSTAGHDARGVYENSATPSKVRPFMAIHTALVAQITVCLPRIPYAVQSSAIRRAPDSVIMDNPATCLKIHTW